MWGKYVQLEGASFYTVIYGLKSDVRTSSRENRSAKATSRLYILEFTRIPMFCTRNKQGEKFEELRPKKQGDDGSLRLCEN